MHKIVTTLLPAISNAIQQRNSSHIQGRPPQREGNYKQGKPATKSEQGQQGRVYALAS